jgi:hypothetical protein
VQNTQKMDVGMKRGRVLKYSCEVVKMNFHSENLSFTMARCEANRLFMRSLHNAINFFILIKLQAVPPEL